MCLLWEPLSPLKPAQSSRVILSFQAVPTSPFAFPDLIPAQMMAGMQCCLSWIPVHGKERKCFLFCTCTLIKPLTSLNCSFPSCLVFPLGVWLLEKPDQDLCPNAMEFAICWTDPSFWGIQDLLHNEPRDCPLPGDGAAWVSSAPPSPPAGLGCSGWEHLSSLAWH